MSKVKNFIPGKPIQKDLYAKRNDTFIREFKAYNKDGSPYDFTGHEFHLQVKNHPDDDEAIIDMTNSSFSIEQNDEGEDADVNNLIVLEHDKSEMDVDGEYVWDLELISPSEQVFTWYEGKFIIGKDVTNSQNGE